MTAPIEVETAGRRTDTVILRGTMQAQGEFPGHERPWTWRLSAAEALALAGALHRAAKQAMPLEAGE